MARPACLVVCINERLGPGQRCCVRSGNLAPIERLQSMIVDAGLDLPVVRRECLGYCEERPLMRFAPAGRFFTAVDETALEAIFTRLITFAVHHAD